MKTITPILISSITNLIEALLGLRIILKLFGASQSALFVRWVYETTQPLLSPFMGMFPASRLTGGFVIEFSSLFALMISAFIGYVAIEFVETLIYYADRRDKHDNKK